MNSKANKFERRAVRKARLGNLRGCNALLKIAGLIRAGRFSKVWKAAEKAVVAGSLEISDFSQKDLRLFAG